MHHWKGNPSKLVTNDPCNLKQKITQALAHYRNPQTPAGVASVWVDRKTLGRQRDCINSNYIDVHIYMDWNIYIYDIYLLFIHIYIWYDMHILYTVKLPFLLKDLRQIVKVNPSKIEVWWVRSAYLERVCTINTYNNSLSFNQSVPPFLSIGFLCQNPHDARSTIKKVWLDSKNIPKTPNLRYDWMYRGSTTVKFPDFSLARW